MGCGWDRDTKTVFFTLDGERLEGGYGADKVKMEGPGKGYVSVSTTNTETQREKCSNTEWIILEYLKIHTSSPLFLQIYSPPFSGITLIIIY